MSEQELTQKENVVAKIIGNVVGLAAVFIVVIIFDINPLKEYGWLGGFFHGGWAPWNWIMSWFSNSVLVKAPIHTNAYNVFWWIGVVLSAWVWISTLFTTIALIRISKKI